MPNTRKSADPVWRLGVVSYLNAKPLIQGLATDKRVELVYDVPARLPELLDRGEVAAALVPVIDLAREDRTWQIVSDACIGCDGESLTVRVFSRVPPESIRTLHVDDESHTSVMLARIIWQERYDRLLEIVPCPSEGGIEQCEAVLLIGDKVIHNRLRGFEIETDLGSAWKSLTSLPFVFAVWAAPAGIDAAHLARLLCQSRDAGVASAERIADEFGPKMGWAASLAKHYLTTLLRYRLSPALRQGLAKFFELTSEGRLIPATTELAFS